MIKKKLLFLLVLATAYLNTPTDLYAPIDVDEIKKSIEQFKESIDIGSEKMDDGAWQLIESDPRLKKIMRAHQKVDRELEKVTGEKVSYNPEERTITDAQGTSREKTYHTRDDWEELKENGSNEAIGYAMEVNAAYRKKHQPGSPEAAEFFQKYRLIDHMVKGAVLDFEKKLFGNLKTNLQKTVFKTSYKAQLNKEIKTSMGMLKKAEVKIKTTEEALEKYLDNLKKKHKIEAEWSAIEAEVKQAKDEGEEISAEERVREMIAEPKEFEIPAILSRGDAKTRRVEYIKNTFSNFDKIHALMLYLKVTEFIEAWEKFKEHLGAIKAVEMLQKHIDYTNSHLYKTSPLFRMKTPEYTIWRKAWQPRIDKTLRKDKKLVATDLVPWYESFRFLLGIVGRVFDSATRKFEEEAEEIKSKSEELEERRKEAYEEEKRKREEERERALREAEEKREAELREKAKKREEKLREEARKKREEFIAEGKAIAVGVVEKVGEVAGAVGRRIGEFVWGPEEEIAEKPPAEEEVEPGPPEEPTKPVRRPARRPVPPRKPPEEERLLGRGYEAVKGVAGRVWGGIRGAAGALGRAVGLLEEERPEQIPEPTEEPVVITEEPQRPEVPTEPEPTPEPTEEPVVEPEEPRRPEVTTEPEPKPAPTPEPKRPVKVKVSQLEKSLKKFVDEQLPRSLKNKRKTIVEQSATKLKSALANFKAETKGKSEADKRKLLMNKFDEARKSATEGYQTEIDKIKKDLWSLLNKLPRESRKGYIDRANKAAIESYTAFKEGLKGAMKPIIASALR